MFHTSSNPFFWFRLNYTFCLGYVNLIIASCQNSIHICYYCTSADRLWQNRWTWMPIPQPHAGLWTSCCSLRQPTHWTLSKQPQTSTAQERKMQPLTRLQSTSKHVALVKVTSNLAFILQVNDREYSDCWVRKKVGINIKKMTLWAPF